MQATSRDDVPFFKKAIHMQKHVHKHQTHSRSWRTHWHWECLSDFINGSTLRRDKWILSQTVWCFSESTPSINEELVKPMVITGVVINKSPKMKSFCIMFTSGVTSTCLPGKPGSPGSPLLPSLPCRKQTASSSYSLNFITKLCFPS